MAQINVVIAGRQYTVEVEDLDRSPVIAVVDGRRYEVYVGGKPAEPLPERPGEEPGISGMVASPPASAPEGGPPGVVTAPMPGDILEVLVQPGQQVAAGDPLVVLEAMKMKNVIYAPRPGRVDRVTVAEGQTVDHGTPLVSLE